MVDVIYGPPQNVWSIDGGVGYTHTDVYVVNVVTPIQTCFRCESYRGTNRFLYLCNATVLIQNSRFVRTLCKHKKICWIQCIEYIIQELLFFVFIIDLMKKALPIGASNTLVLPNHWNRNIVFNYFCFQNKTLLMNHKYVVLEESGVNKN